MKHSQTQICLLSVWNIHTLELVYFVYETFTLKFVYLVLKHSHIQISVFGVWNIHTLKLVYI